MSSTLVREAASTSMRSTKRPSSISLQDAQTPQGVAVTPVSQLRHFERMRAMVVLPTPRVPVNRNAWCTRPCVERVAQRLAHVLLADQLGEGTRPPLARQREITHRCAILEPDDLGGSPHQPDFGARHRRYRCSLPGLTGFTTSRREGADTDCHGKEVADRQGFEPWNTVRCYLLSKQAPSTARPPVRERGAVSRTSRGRIIAIVRYFGFAASALWASRTAAECRGRARSCRGRAPACRGAGP